MAQHLCLKQVLPLVLSKQGQRVFHASAVEVEVEDGAVVFAAESGRGKSTLAASGVPGTVYSIETVRDRAL
jgi:ATP-dependent phosphoenolpyruvate carboxykinase